MVLGVCVSWCNLVEWVWSLRLPWESDCCLTTPLLCTAPAKRVGQPVAYAYVSRMQVWQGQYLGERREEADGWPDLQGRLFHPQTLINGNTSDLRTETWKLRRRRPIYDILHCG